MTDPHCELQQFFYQNGYKSILIYVFKDSMQGNQGYGEAEQCSSHFSIYVQNVHDCSLYRPRRQLRSNEITNGRCNGLLWSTACRVRHISNFYVIPYSGCGRVLGLYNSMPRPMDEISVFYPPCILLTDPSEKGFFSLGETRAHNRFAVHAIAAASCATFCHQR